MRSIFRSLRSRAPYPSSRSLGHWHCSRRSFTATRPTASKLVTASDNFSMKSQKDPTTLSNYHDFLTKHTKANLQIDFGKKCVAGDVELTLESTSRTGSKEVVLDTSYLDVQNVTVNQSKQEWSLTPRVEPFGSPLAIKLQRPIGLGESIQLKIEYATTDKCTALQWLTPAQAGTEHPYMFSQCQAIHARSLFPCQDTPAVKSTYEFLIRSPYPVLASGLPRGKEQYSSSAFSGYLFTFNQDIAMPSYLFALASGDLVSADIGPRSTVWSTQSLIEQSKWEFESTEAYIQAAEKLVNPYSWGTYNILVLPPSFPYGGMENPVNIYVTPTVVSGDRQNTDVIAHELCHSWSGNLVSPVSWEHFWLNEGWTTYLERRLQAKLHGEAHRDFSAIIGWKALQDSVERFGEENEFTKLVVDLKGKDPDDAFSSVPYEKGATFLWHLEKLVGKEIWDRFIPHYFSMFKQKSLDSYEFKTSVLEFFSDDKETSKKLEGVPWDDWFHKPGFPPKHSFDTSLADACYDLANKWKDLSQGKTGFKPSKEDMKGWFGQQCYVFLETIDRFDPPLSQELVERMGMTYDFFKSQNVELTSRYYVIALKARAKVLYGPAAELLGRVGRMKFCRPLFKELLKADRQLAIKTFEEHKDFYHPICRQMLEKMMADSGAS